jgi:hypothetical protein
MLRAKISFLMFICLLLMVGCETAMLSHDSQDISPTCEINRTADVIELSYDREQEMCLQECVDQGHQPWRLDPAIVASVALREEFGEEIEFDRCRCAAIRYTDNGIVVTCEGSKTYQVLLRQLVREDDYGIWTAVRIIIDNDAFAAEHE